MIRMPVVTAYVLLTLCLFFPQFSEAFEKGDFLVRVRAIGIIPNDSSGSLSSIPKSGVEVDSSYSGEVDFTYMFTSNIGTELILATTKHTINGRKALSGTEIGTVWVLPPTLTIQYHFCPCNKFQPYAGIGVNYTTLYHENSSIEDTKLSLNNSWGVAGQVGFDYLFNGCWFFNFDAKYIQLDTKATLKGTVAGHVNVDIDPWVIGIGIGRKF
jgi:outer membrane protein